MEKVDGNEIGEAEFFDCEKKERIKVKLPIRDIILFKLIEKLHMSMSQIKH